LKKLSIRDISVPDFSGLDSNTLVELELDNVSGLTSLSFLKEFPSASRLERLAVRESGLQSTQGLSAAKSLRSLNVGNNNLRELAEITELKSLQSLSASRNKIENVSGLEQLSKLSELTLFSNQLVTLPPMKQLEVAELSTNQISDLSFLSETSMLRTLSVSANNITSLDAIANHRLIETLDVSNNPVQEPFTGLWLASIKSLRMNSVALSGLEFLSESHLLEKLYVANTQIGSLAPISSLPRLKALFAGGTPVSELTVANSDLCPTEGSNAVSKFCKRLFKNSDLSPDVSWRFQ
ncbi:MAG: hypothetical protein AAF202_10075, partial [Pseudomonadota bacterium]